MLRYDFPLYSLGSLTLSEQPDTALLAAEVERSAAAHRAAAPARVARGAMTSEEAERIGLVLDSIAADLAAVAALRPGERLRDRVPRPGDRWTWEDKIHVLRREIHFRRAFDPGHVEKGRLTAAAAKERLERLEAVHDAYWREWLLAWPWPDGGADPDWASIAPSPAARLTREALRAHWRSIATSSVGAAADAASAPPAGQEELQGALV